MSKTLNTRVQLKKDTEANFAQANPILLDGEEILVVCSDGKIKRKIGDGVSRYSQLPFPDDGGGLDIDRILFDGLPYSTKTISSDGRTITSKDSAGMTLTETMSADFKTCTSVLKDQNGVTLGQLVQVLAANGLSITATLTK